MAGTSVPRTFREIPDILTVALGEPMQQSRSPQA